MIIAAKESGRQTDQGDSRSAFLEGRRYQLFCALGGEALFIGSFCVRPLLYAHIIPVKAKNDGENAIFGCSA